MLSTSSNACPGRRGLLCVFALCLFLSPLGAQEKPAGAENRTLTLEAIAPQDTVLFASFAGVSAASKAAESMGLFRFFQEKQTQLLLAGLIAKYKELASHTPESDLQMWETLKRALSGRLSMAVTGSVTYNGRDSTIPLPAMVFALDVGSHRQEAAALLDEALERMTPLLDEFGVEESMKPFKGVDIRLFKSDAFGMKVTICTAFLENLLLISVNQGPIRKCINLSKSSMAKTLVDNPSFRRSRSKSSGDNIIEVYAGVKPALKRFRLFIPDEIQEQMEVLGLGSVEALYYASGVRDGDGLDTMYLDAPAPRTGLLALDNGQPLSAASLSIIPEDALAVLAHRCDLAKAWDHIWNSLNQFLDDDVLGGIRGGIAQVEGGIGLRLREDILATLGDEIVVYASMPRDLRLPKIVASVGIRDRAKAEKIIPQLLVGIPAVTREFKVREHTVHLITPPAGTRGGPISPCYALLEDRLLISPTRSGLEEALARLDNPQIASIDGSANFQGTMSGLPWKKASLLWYVDARRLLTLGYEAAYDTLPGMIPANFPVDIAQMPDLSTFVKHVNGFGGACWGDDDGVVFQSRSLLAPALNLALLAAAADRTPGAMPWVMERFIGELSR